MALVCLDDFRAYAKRHLPKGTWDYFEGGADECATRDDNILAFKRIRLRPRVLKNVSTVDTRTTIQGTEISCPVSIAPTGFHCLAWPDGETSMARGAEAQGVCYVTSMYSTSSLTDIVAAAPSGLRWFQLYMHKDRQLVTELVREVEALGFRVLVLTVDTPVGGKRRADLRNSFGLPAHLSLQIIPEARQVGAGHQLPIADIDPSVCWEDVSWLRSLTRLPIVLKGILTREDAEQAVGRGVQGILVSNHGGRQLDGVLATVGGPRPGGLGEPWPGTFGRFLPAGARAHTHTHTHTFIHSLVFIERLLCAEHCTMCLGSTSRQHIETVQQRAHTRTHNRARTRLCTQSLLANPWPWSCPVSALPWPLFRPCPCPCPVPISTPG
ncbi:hydroxyacid oxidase 2 isoform X1 [Tachyglossus aculeatus]|uniref:hydroxyacid oxidase 2 isoform X1 n=1 Tax=Tachyglossus aculeatus TaxID=9261 RepID=UPI0018F58A4B|nr:hydroxyacid oxidase 2 isoform X1 [Tachyglossus aculeatus]XP_038614446.1 hydroxyacid oxidase 2 isoform X1 [Tachyglossus aculeatus]XP_038614447.1 hydroxyacid oxidase 2 isoform X1 [Tachyglossus aculeatus]XP_038614448.1 hydroxyacid oxidase 2 isoform X1 [Tachyglossus aculeatus]XP_038614449.1 hydroxyacid oxidase 2 isoform X1 [Tachyglossus aculeatus]XP_038614450.1 hydroxyacid oxidase 2 isoform X1 [Tachyglossus aculeatus]XP_038614451.1 hydroxyacid oxidase 2 isoform X1 [Tachyglossus aculeatus]XP_0